MINKIIGIMSGTSLDGLDIALCKFSKINEHYNFDILQAETIEYSSEWRNRLKNAASMSASDFCRLNVDYGNFVGDRIADFIGNTYNRNLAVGSHGHTIFHQPINGITVQIGSGAHIASKLKIPVVCNFREYDVALGGQGAPLVPIGDKLLFKKYDMCINLGGFSNISFDNSSGLRVAYDICPVNILINYFAKKKGLDYDENGKIGRTGEINIQLLKKLNDLDYYKKSYPKSLGREWVEKEVLSLIYDNIPIRDVLRTLYEHIAIQISTNISPSTKVLFTGGGVYNSFLMELINKYSNANIIIPDKNLINYKEALIFAFLAYLKLNNEINVLASVTGASKDHSAGIIYN